MDPQENRASIADILSAPVIRSTVNTVLGKEPYDIVERPGAYVLSLKKEPTDRCRRVIVLKPKGFTSNGLEVLSSHPEAGEATIEIKGAARPENNGYFPIKNCIEFVYRDKDDVETQPGYPYAGVNGAFRKLKTSRMKFKAVKRNYRGFYHNLINLTNEWLVLVLDKRLNLTKQVDYTLFESAGKRHKDILHGFAAAVRSDGDGIFESKSDVVRHVCAIDPRASLPALITLLNVEERGRHEQCTVFAVILRIAKTHPVLALELLRKAEIAEAAPPYYLHELIKKVSGYLTTSKRH